MKLESISYHLNKPRVNQSAIVLPAVGRSIQVLHNAVSYSHTEGQSRMNIGWISEFHHKGIIKPLLNLHGFTKSIIHGFRAEVWGPWIRLCIAPNFLNETATYLFYLHHVDHYCILSIMNNKKLIYDFLIVEQSKMMKNCEIMRKMQMNFI